MTEIAKIEEATPAGASEGVTEVVDAAVSWLNRTSQVSGIRLAAEVSSYILTTFFDGDFKQFSSHDRTKPSSFSALCRREDLNLGESTLYRLVRIGHQVQLLPTAVAESLSLTHHRVLLAVEDPRQKQRIAKAAVNENWTVERLEAETRKLRPKDATKAGRPPLPTALKVLGQVARAWGKGLDVESFAVEFGAMDVKQRELAKVGLAKMAEAIAGLLAVVDGQGVGGE